MSMLRVNLPDNCRDERRYVLDVILGEFLGIAFSPTWDAVATGIEIRSGASDGMVLRVDDTFFTWAAGHWLRPVADLPLAGPADSLPQARFDQFSGALPVLFGKPLANGTWLDRAPRATVLGIDVFGAAFFMLTRYEELVLAERDAFDRFPAAASIAGRGGFLNRPIIDEYVELMWSELQRLFPAIQRKRREFRIRLSHDVDLPLKHGFSPWYRTAVAALRDAVKEGPLAAVDRLVVWRAVNGGQPERDPFNTFDWLMTLAERHALQTAFYFIADRRHPNDGLYDIDHPFIGDRMRAIHARGHEIGLHPSFTTYLDEAQTAHEFVRLKSACERAGVRQSRWGGRQHFLRWRNPQSLRNWERAGLQYDSTLGYAERDGFRCGTCHEYPAYDLVERQSLALRLRPLIVMDATFSRYLKLGFGQRAQDHIATLKNACRLVQGDFVLLWHNSELVTAQQRETIQAALEM